jgi:hypothetical protein
VPESFIPEVTLDELKARLGDRARRWVDGLIADNPEVRFLVCFECLDTEAAGRASFIYVVGSRWSTVTLGELRDIVNVDAKSGYHRYPTCYCEVNRGPDARFTDETAAD